MSVLQVWLYIDSPLRLALQDSFAPENFHAALMELVRRHIRRMHHTEFFISCRRMSAGLRLGCVSLRSRPLRIPQCAPLRLMP